MKSFAEYVVDHYKNIFESIDDLESTETTTDSNDIEEAAPNTLYYAIGDIADELDDGGKIHDALINTIAGSLQKIKGLDIEEEEWVENLIDLAYDAYENIKNHINSFASIDK